MLGTTPEQLANYAEAGGHLSLAPTFQIAPEVQLQLNWFVRNGKGLLAIRLLRQVTGCSHNAAKRWLDANCCL